MKRIESQKTFLYFDCFSGISGDMACGALADLTGDIEMPARVVESLGIEEVEVYVEERMSAGIRGLALSVSLASGEGRARNLDDVVRLFSSSELPSGVVARCVGAFEKLAEVEGRIHGVSPAEVHFHEVGAWDSIVDVALFFSYLEEISPAGVYASPLPFTEGEVTCSHGTYPVPAPATVEIAREAKVVWRRTGAGGELVTPTGVLLLAQGGARFEKPSSFVLEGVGYGVGARDLEGRPNVVRVMRGKVVGFVGEDRVFVVETNVDDMNPQRVGYLFDVVLESGAYDFSVVPATMKKNRPGWILSAIVAEERLNGVLSVLFSHTTTIGVRMYEVMRYTLDRKTEEVETPWGKVRYKVVTLPGGEKRGFPEYDDLKIIAREKGISIHEAAKVAEDSWRRRK